MRIGCFFLSLALMFSCALMAQRQYQASSVLGSGSWYQLAVKEAGVYKVDLPMLRQLGVSNSSIPVGAIRLFGNGGAMLPEACNATVPDDLVENAIEVIDDGDGFFNGSDYFLFYAPGPDRWIADTINRAFRHQKNLYTDKAFYYISIGGNGKRIALQTAPPPANITVTSFSEHWFHELESSNLLNGSKDWLGEELSAAPGKTISLATAFTNPVETEPASMQAACVARSVNGSSRFTFSINNQSILQQDIASVGSSSQDLFARRFSATASITATAGAAITCAFTGNNSAQGWLDWLEVFYRRKLLLGTGTQLFFRDWSSLSTNGNARFSIEQAAGAEVWDVSEPAMPVKMSCITGGSNLDFTNTSASLHEYCCFKQSFLLPTLLGKLSNQDIHAAAPAGMLIICYPPFLAQARRIADFHQQQDQLSSLVLTTQQVFNEFSGGSPDPVAIRNCMKMFYDRAGA
ncbi:MAG TPA: C25 family cysteine peptidase, partial [Chitinophagaceae bacterium]|nr:C25 family cysteine peptidase [Chitinophagaceae bacterium]